jgi:hypothetical protein
MKWQDYKDEFEFDGSWRDIYVFTTDVSDWQRLIDFLRSGVYEYSCTLGGEEATLPSYAREMFEAGYEFRPLLSVNVGSVVLNCHFFTEEEIEFDLDPREIKGELQAEQVFAFMRRIGRILDKEVILTPENAQNVAIFKFFPGARQIQYVSCTT